MISDPAQKTGPRAMRRGFIPLALFLGGCFIIAIGDRLETSPDDVHWAKGIGYLLVIASPFFIRRARWKLLFLVPAAYVGSIVVSLALFPLAAVVVNTDVFAGECRGVTDYFTEISAINRGFDSRLSLSRSSDFLNYSEYEDIINDIDDDISTIEQLSPPAVAETHHRQQLLVFRGWTDMMRELQDGNYPLRDATVLREEWQELNRMDDRILEQCG